LRQQLAHIFALAIRVHTTNVQIPALSAIAGPILLETFNSGIENGGTGWIGRAVWKNGEGK
jgi:hypothetical protein